MTHSRVRLHNCHQQAGFTLVTVLLVAVILLTLLAAVSTMVLAESRQTGLTARQQQAYNLAEAGLERFMTALQRAAQGDLNQFPYDPQSLTGWVQTQGIEQPGISVQATYVDENGRAVTSNGLPYPHLIQVRSTGSVDQVQKTVEATVDLQYLGNIFLYVLAAVGQTGVGIQFDPNMSLSLFGSMYTNADLATTDPGRKIPRWFYIQNGTLDLGPDAPLTGTERWFPSNVTIQKLPKPLAVPSFDRIMQALQARTESSNIQIFEDGGTHYLFRDLWGRWWDFWKGSHSSRLWSVDSIKWVLMYTSPDATVVVFGYPASRTIVVNGKLQIYPTIMNNSSPSLFLAKKDVMINADLLENIQKAFQLDIEILWNQVMGTGSWETLVLPLLVASNQVAGYIYAPNGAVTVHGSQFILFGSMIAQKIRFESSNWLYPPSVTIRKSSETFDQKNPWYIPQPVIVERHTK